jgi:hypothetical protein
MRRLLVVLVAVLSAPSPLRSPVHLVRAGDDLQAALNAARAGDEIRLAAGSTFTGNFLLPAFDGNATVTLRTDLPDDRLPAASQRVTPAAAASFARIVSPNGTPAMRTAAGAHHWRLAFLQFPSNKDGYGDIIDIGDGSAAQTQASQVPFEIELDHLYVHGDPLIGQKRGIALNGRAITIRACYVSDIKAVGADTQAIGGWNGPGPFTIENNYLEASGENFLLGGADPAIPDLVSEDVVVRHNLMSRPMAWRDPIVPAPSGVTAAAGGSGTLPAGTYVYRVVARRPTGMGTTGTSSPSEDVRVEAAGGSVTLTWPAVPNAADYVVYGRAPAGADQAWTVTSPHFTDTGTAGKNGTPPKEATRWQIKNVFELKNARRVRVDGNVIENNWQAAQPGYAVLFTPRNSSGGCPWCVVEDVEFSGNVVRNTSAGMNILGHDSPRPSRQTTGIRIHDNLFTGITTTLGGNGWPLLLGDGPRDVVVDRNTFEFDGTTLLYVYGAAKVTGFQFTNNAGPHGTYGINGAGASSGTLTLQTFFPGAVVTGNWLSGGSASRYPAGNRFDAPFDAKKTAPAGVDPARFRPLVEAVVSGVATAATSSTK